MTIHLDIDPGDHYVFRAGGRTVHLWLHECRECTSLDVWTDRGRIEAISANTGDGRRAPTGVFLFRNGARTLTDDPVEEGSFGWPATGTATLIWDTNN